LTRCLIRRRREVLELEVDRLYWVLCTYRVGDRDICADIWI